jgi:Polysaccharide pyruvyl transferase.
MRIAILTLPLHTNYGGILQAYALQTVLQRMGHEVVVIDYDPYYSPLRNWKKPLSYTKRFFEKIFFKKSHLFLLRNIIII